MEKVKYNEQGICPFCGGTINYVDNNSDLNCFIKFWNCPYCGSKGEEVYSFIGHFNCSKDNYNIDCVEDELEK